MTKGFTLMEVLIALVILSVTFLWLLSAQSQGIDMAMRSKFLTTSTMLSQERISQVVSGVLAVSVGQDQGDFGADYPGYTFEETMETTPLAGYRKYSLTVRWGGKGSPLESTIIAFIAEK